MRSVLHLERKHDPHAPRSVFGRRLALYVGLSALLVGGSLAIGMCGYAHYEGLAWRDAFLNAAMLLGGMGPVHAPATPGGKIFAGLYALYAGLVFLVAVAVAFAPIVHRLLHKFHVEPDPPDASGA